MALTAVGFDGSISEVQFANLMNYVNGNTAVGGYTDFKVTQFPSQRAVSVASGNAYQAGVQVTNSAAISITLPAPSVGQWFLIVLRRNWNTNACSVLALPGATSTSSSPGGTPNSYPDAYVNSPGGQCDQRLAWVFATASSTSVTIVDLRVLPNWFPKRGSSSARDAYYGDPSSTPARLALTGASWYNTDFGWEERYRCTTDDNAANGASGGEGWYPNEEQHYSTGYTGNFNKVTSLGGIKLEALPYATRAKVDVEAQFGFSSQTNATLSVDWAWSGGPTGKPGLYSFEQFDINAPTGATWNTYRRVGFMLIPAGFTGTLVFNGTPKTNQTSYFRGAFWIDRWPNIRGHANLRDDVIATG